jgi:hypothetical protein
MAINKHQFYRWSAYLLGSGLLYVLLHLAVDLTDLTVCVFKIAFDIPCVACGSTRAVLAFISGHWSDIIKFNPLGVLSFGLFAAFGWLWSYDSLNKTDKLWHQYQQFESLIRKPVFYLPSILLLLANWTWNITKGL